MTATVCGLGKGNPSSNELATSAVAIKDELEAGIAAIGRVLDARGGDALHSDLETGDPGDGLWGVEHDPLVRNGLRRRAGLYPVAARR